jgi:hypothetical protein
VPVKKVPVKAVMVVREPKPAMAKTAGVENTAGAKPAAMKCCATASEAAAMEGRSATAETSAAVKGRAPAMEAAAAAMETASPTAVETASAAATMAASATAPMATAADFSRQPV